MFRRIAMRPLTVAAALALLASPALAQEGAWGDIKGRVVWPAQREIPKQMPIASVNAHADKAHCLKDGPVLDEIWVVNPKNRGLRWTFVWLVNADPQDKTPLPVHPDLREIKKKEVEIDQPVC